MTWSNSFFISFLSGALGLVCGGFIMNLCVDWYRVSSFEGKGGFAVVGVALLGGIAGLVIGLVASRMAAAGENPAFLKGLAYGCGTVLGIAAAATLLCRLGADSTRLRNSSGEWMDPDLVLPKSNAPLKDFLSFINREVPEDQKSLALMSIEDRQEQLADLIRSNDSYLRGMALGAVVKIQKIRPLLEQAMRAEAKDLGEAIRDFNVMEENDPDFQSAQVDLINRFNDWNSAWQVVCEQLGIDGRPPLREIHDLAQKRGQGIAMHEIVVNARVILDALDSAP